MIMEMIMIMLAIILTFATGYFIRQEAKKFGNLRKKCKWYYVTRSAGLFGDFHSWYISETRILARTHKEAAQRYAKRYYDTFPVNSTTKQWAKYKVREIDKPDHPKYHRYYK